MKNKSVILAAMMAGALLQANAQENNKNIFVSVGVGVQGTTNPDSDFGKTITPLINVSVGKLFTPVWGIRGQVYGWSSKMETSYPFPVTANEVERKERYFGLNVDGMLNLTNLIGGYNEDRKWDLNFFAGPSMNIVKNYSGWNLAYKAVPTENAEGTTIVREIDPANCKPTGHSMRYLVGASLGLGAKYNINPNWAVDLEVRGQVTPSILGAYSSGSTDGYLHMNIGATYTFGGKGFAKTKLSQKEMIIINEKVNEYKHQLQASERKVAELQANPVVKTEVRTEIKEVEVAGPRSVFFKLGSSEVDKYGDVNLKQAAEIMKQNPDKKYKIVGYTDKATGTKAVNEKIAQKRAEAVYNILVAEGVKPEQLEISTVVDGENMFGSNDLNRVVIIE